MAFGVGGCRAFGGRGRISIPPRLRQCLDYNYNEKENKRHFCHRQEVAWKL